jgi:hypothetical protein
MRTPLISSLVALLTLAFPPLADAQKLSNEAFQIEYDGSGIRVLRRTNDIHDTNYIAPNGSLGPVLIRFRTTPNGDWRILRDVILDSLSSTDRQVSYVVGTLPPSLAGRSSPSAAVGVAGLRGLNDGLVPSIGPAGGGRGGGPGAPAIPGDLPAFTWSGSRGGTQWVQYTFPAETTVSRVEVFWTAPPKSWRLLYQEGRQWKEVQARGSYGVEPNTFIPIEFDAVTTMAMRVEVTMDANASVSMVEWRVGPPPIPAPSSDLAVKQTFVLKGDVLDWSITLANNGSKPVEIGDLAVPFNFAERTGARGDIYTKKLLRHALVAGHGSWVYWQRSNAAGPYLVMTPAGETKFELFDSSGGMGAVGFGAFTPYIHAIAARTAAVAAGGNWRLPVTNLTLGPQGSAAAAVTYRFRFQWARDVAGVREVLYKEGKFDTTIVPGMVVPTDLPALIALRSVNKIDDIQIEHPSATKLELVERKPDGTGVYRVEFSRLGENMLKIRYGGSQWTSLEFFVTEPLETLISKRAAFLVDKHQHKDPSKWYVGVYSDWDQKNEILRSPEDRDGLSAWLTDANDDAGNARPAFIASKNVFFPNHKEIESLELYISKYLWGGMQMTDREKYPYAVYGIPNWKANRDSADEGRNGQSHVWRIYDYPHIIMLYHRMYLIAKFYPDKISHLNAATYLERAYRTATAYWTVPLAVEKWSADAVGTMNEAFVPELIQALEDEGKGDWAADVRRHWEGKVERFINRTPNLYGSEFAFDSTGFESTGAFAKYAMTHDMAGVTREAAQKFLDFQLLLNMSDRGWLEPTYYQLGSDYRGNLTYLLSYMSQMGGWSILDHGLYRASHPAEYLRLGYASSLSSWALVNSGTEQSGYGYWFPSRNNDGATGGGFMPEPLGRAWIGKQMTRGAWYYSAEEDVGYCGALRTHATIVARDPIFGEIAYGGLLRRDGQRLSVVPRDGLRVRFHVVRDDQRLHMELDHDGFAKDQAVVIADDLSRIQFVLENRTGRAHETGLMLAGLPNGEYTLSVEGRSTGTISGSDRPARILISVGSAATAQIQIARIK